MKPEIWAKYPGMKELVLKFVAPGLWEKHKSELARKVCCMPQYCEKKHNGQKWYIKYGKKMNMESTGNSNIG